MKGLEKINGNNQFKPNYSLYLTCGSVSIVMFGLFVGLAQILNFWSNGFYAFAGLFGGIMASVVVAWLVDEQNCKSKNCDSKSLCDEIWRRFDMDFKCETELRLASLARKIDFDIDKDWSISEFLEMINTSKNQIDFTTYFERISTIFLKVDIDKLLYPFYSETNRAIYSISQGIICNIKAKANWNVETVLILIEIIYSYRHLNPVFKIAEKDKDMIERFRDVKRSKISNN